MVGRTGRVNWTDLSGAYLINRSSIVIYIGSSVVRGDVSVVPKVGRSVGGGTAYSTGDNNRGGKGDDYLTKFFYT